LIKPAKNSASSDIRVLIVSAADRHIGFGHLKRSLAVGKVARENGFDVRFLVLGDKVAEAEVRSENFSCTLVDRSGLDYRNLDYLYSDVVIADVLFPGFFSDPGLVHLIKHLRALGRCSVVIDVLGIDSFAVRAPDTAVNLVVSPYVLSDAPIATPSWRYVAGPEFAMLPPEYSNIPDRHQRVETNRVLVTCGGSDQQESSIKVIKALDLITETLEVRVVIGPLFTRRLKKQLEILASRSKHEIILIDRPASLVAHMLWCSVAISTSGLTKYELAATGTPAILFSIDKEHDRVNLPFARYKTAINLGVGIDVDSIAKETIKLLNDASLREDLAHRGKMLIDGRGIQRVIEEIMRELIC
jgi:UDP-2,4-diacetamido-2,4,6-trideoxy-beta-L-altropyranose hydrolase